jgi:hypothetical protein
VIHAQKMQNPVQHQDAKFVGRGVSELFGLIFSAVYRDGDFADETLRGTGRKGQNVGGIVVAEEVAVQALQFSIASEQASEVVAARDFGAQPFGEAAQFRTRQPDGSTLK